MKKRKKAPKPVKKIHFWASWDIIETMEIVEAYEQKYGSFERLPYIEQKKIYKGNLLDAITFEKIDRMQRFGVKFYCEFHRNENPDEIIKMECSYRIQEPMTLKELIDGCKRVNVDIGHGLTVKGWKGASRAWLDEIEDDFGRDITWLKATAIANCLANTNY